VIAATTGWPITAPGPPPSTRETPAAKNANTGRARPEESGLTRCSYWAVRAVVSPCLASAGTVKPSSTPAMVAWTPDACISAHATIASGSSTNHRGLRERTCHQNSPTQTSVPSSGSQWISLV
jgi:hypothetical protein